MIPYGRQCLDEEDIRAVTDVLKGDWLTTGPSVEAFERAVADHVGVRHAVAVANGTVALHFAVLSLGLKNGFLGLTSPLTFAASANAVLYGGGRLGLVDIAPRHPGLSVERLEHVCEKGDAPNVIIPVSYAGYCPDLPRLKELSDRYGFKLIEDASHSLGTTFSHGAETHHSGDCTFTDLATLSFHPVKNITAAEGGMILTNDNLLYDRLLALRNHGMEKRPERMEVNDSPPWRYEVQSLGFNGRLSDLHAALGLSQMKKLGEFKARRRDLAEIYDSAFSGIEELITLEEIQAPLDSLDPFLHLYPLRLRNPDQRDLLYNHLRSESILAQVHYLPIHHHPHFKKYLPEDAIFPEADRFFESELSLPLFPDLKEREQDHVINSVKALLSAK